MRARPLAPWAKFLLLLLLVVLLMVLALVAFAVAQQGGKGVGAAGAHRPALFLLTAALARGPCSETIASRMYGRHRSG